MKSIHDLELYPAVTAIAEVTVNYHYTCLPDEMTVVKQSFDAYELIKPWYNEDMEFREVAYAMYLNQANQLVAIHRVGVGGITSSVIDCRIVLMLAIRLLTPQIILAHNHPSGSLKPSDADKNITQRIKHGGQLVDIRLLDHLIVTRSGFFSMADNGPLIVPEWN